jgi:Cys-tRNA(Pro) deacylase
MDAYPTATQRFLERVGDAGVPTEPLVFPGDAKTSQQAADALGCHVSQITKSLVFIADDAPLMVLMAGDHRVNVAAVAQTVGAQGVRRAELDEVRQTTGYVAGATPPLGHVKEMKVLADRSITDNDVVWVAAGSPKTLFAIGVHDLVRLS